MSRFQVQMQPSILTDPEGLITIRFAQPTAAENVTVTLLEMDAWSFDRETMTEQAASNSEPIAEFTGTIERRRFQIAERREMEAPDDAPTIKVQFQGGEELQIPVPNAAFAAEGGELELGLRVRGDVRRGRRTTSEDYTTPSPVFIRHCGDATGPMLTFITGQDRGRNRFFNAATRYWQPRVDGLIRLGNVEDILAYLNTQANLDRFGGPWGEINIVSHANPNQWMIRLFRGQPAITHVVEDTLSEHGNDSRLVPPGADALNENSRIVIRGCAIGSNQALLDGIRRLFGDRATVYAPKYIQAYEWRRRGRLQALREHFWETFSFYLPGRRSPGNDECAERLARDYADRGITDEQWQQLLQSRGGGVRHDATESFTWTIDYEEAPSRNPDEQMQELRDTFPGGEAQAFHTTVDDWEWGRPRRQVNARRGIYRLVFRGDRRHVEVRRPLRNEDGHDIVPNLADSTHYGRSPAW